MSDERRRILDAALALDENLAQETPRGDASAKSDPSVSEDATDVPYIRDITSRRGLRPTD